MTLGKDAAPIEIDSSEANRVASLSLTRQAREEVLIMSRHLDRPIYDRTEFVDNIKELALTRRRARIRILVQDSRPVVKSGHRLLELARRIDSSIELRKPSKDYADYNAAFLVVDAVGFVMRTYSDRYEALVNFYDRGTAGELRQQFEEIWKLAGPDPELRRLSL